MDKILFISHTEENGGLSEHALEVLTAAAELANATSSELTIGLFGGSTAAAVKQISGTVFTVEGAEFAVPRYATDAAAAEAIVNAAQATVVVAPGDSRMMRFLSGVAARLNGKVDAHITSITAGAEISLNRWYYRQRMQAEIKRSARPWFFAVESGIFQPCKSAGAAQVKALNVSLSPALTRTTVQGVKAPQSGEQTIKPDAKLLFVAGAGWTKKQKDGQTHVPEAADLILGFIKKAGASLGSSKSLVDLQGEGQQVLPFMTHLNQVGQTGSTPRHPKGLAACCHGEEPHVVGWRFINERRAISLDANCGWAQGKADVLYVADAFEVIKEVNRLLANFNSNSTEPPNTHR
ncbi:MAG: electron transfer flavoprotein subunit alpha [Calditrichaeota bacterium]|nr:MAG: electron transfer flavoprotein subunit alpha [Calditrichota bacterium]